MEISDSGKVTEFKDLHPEKAYLPMDVIDLGK